MKRPNHHLQPSVPTFTLDPMFDKKKVSKIPQKKKAAFLIEKLLFVWLLKLGSNQRPSD